MPKARTVQGAGRVRYPRSLKPSSTASAETSAGDGAVQPGRHDGVRQPGVNS
ncbi:hypothetical protein [Streptomyces sp. NPDC055709]